MGPSGSGTSDDSGVRLVANNLRRLSSRHMGMPQGYNIELRQLPRFNKWPKRCIRGIPIGIFYGDSYFASRVST
ncbi:hypothetical protein PILCRDRAFT_827937 [Piloderma croceum F 1598]|uniref:Uncharacterized protein n=1 Tax=Piloderma croceum (strain F 1598) TaxID=765440 RepID=A0A0C3BBN5_PILCF|nr:hypothetical protein PILCRDRAFT_827937 [Piloderma croceum F 1598]